MINPFTFTQPLILASAALAVAFSPQSFPGTPYPENHLVPRQSSTNDTAPNFTHDELLALQQKFWDAFIYPNNVAQAKSINSSILASNVQGRVDITRTFTGAELNTEYLFGLFANLAQSPSSFTLLGYPTSYEIVHFAASGNIVASSTLLNFTFPILPSTPVPLIIEQWSAFNAQGQVAQYDVTFKYWQWAFETLIASAATAYNMSVPQITTYAQGKLAESICDTAVTYCNTTAGVAQEDLYANKQACSDFLTKDIRFGEPYELGRNTLLCRMVHQNMVPFRPAVHCPHIGPTGGGYCDDDKNYAQTVLESYFTNYPWGV